MVKEFLAVARDVWSDDDDYLGDFSTIMADDKETPPHDGHSVDSAPRPLNSCVQQLNKCFLLKAILSQRMNNNSESHQKSYDRV